LVDKIIRGPSTYSNPQNNPKLIVTQDPTKPHKRMATGDEEPNKTTQTRTQILNHEFQRTSCFILSEKSGSGAYIGLYSRGITPYYHTHF
jgi:hypothetical protein